MLERFWGFHEPWEAALATAPWKDFAFTPLPRAPALLSDLLRLGATREQVAAMPTARPPTFAGRADALGVLYVLEGSRLGGEVIRRALAPVLGSDVGYAFFGGDGHTGTSWRRFVVALDQAVTSPAERDAAEAGAVDAFAALIEWFAPLDARHRLL